MFGRSKDGRATLKSFEDALSKNQGENDEPNHTRAQSLQALPIEELLDGLNRYNLGKSAKIIASELKDINTQINMLDMREDLGAQQKMAIKKGLLE